MKYPKFRSVVIIIISIVIIFSCAYYKTLKEGLTNNNDKNNIILMGDSVLNNSNYVPKGKSVYDNLKTKLDNVLNVSEDGATINDLYLQLDKIPIELNSSETFIFISAGGNNILNKQTNTDITQLFDSFMDFLNALRAKLSNVKINIIYYLDNKSIQIAFIENTNEKWEEKVISQILNKPQLPHIIILEFYDRKNKITKSKEINVEGAKYILDSCVIRDTTHQHFSANLTCDHKEVAYDGMSFHRLVPMNWKKYINTDFSWGFEGSNNSNGTPLKWNFTNCYQMLIYYRVK